MLSRHLLEGVMFAVGIAVGAMILLAVLSYTTSTGSATDPVEPEVWTPPASHQDGGNVDAYIAHVNQLNADGVRVELTMLACTSACTFYLSAWDVCVGENSLFRFHGPQNFALSILGIPVRGLPQEDIDHVTNIMAENYNMRWPGLGDWFAKYASEKWGMAFTTVRGQSLNHSFGIPICEPT